MTDRTRVEQIFEDALELNEAERADFVRRACGDDAAMLDAVKRLLAAHDRSEGILEQSPVPAAADDAMPARLGPYRLHRVIGSGGMGVVYDAERDDGQFRRRVAIKIIRRGSDPETLRRVLAERQILAGLDHPNIAHLLDGGATPDGRPYLVMEHVDGLPIDVYCERMQLTVAERLALFMTVARAVDFAHQNLIVHRDLKPSNILVTPDGRAKLLDFGVAKLLHPWLVPDSPVTRELRALTREYASPEQLRAESLTTTTDVYSLGVVLYELLTGRRPHEEHEGSLAEHTAAVCEGRFERASNRAPRLARELRGDVDAILDKALRPEPLRRYSSAELLAQDIANHLEHRPVMAHQGSRGYALRKAIRRNRPQAAALAFALVALLGGAGAAAWQATIAERERESAELARHSSEQVTSFLIGLFDAGDQPQLNASMHDLIRRGRDAIYRLDAQPEVKARVLGAMGAIQEGLGEYVDAQHLTEQALDLLNSTRDSALYADLLVRHGTMLRRLGELDSAEAVYFRARDIQQRTIGMTAPAFHQTLYYAVEIALYRRDLVEAERRAREVLDIQETVLGEAHRLRVNTMTQLGSIQLARGDMAGAERTLRAAIALRPRAAGSTLREIRHDRFQLANVVSDNADRNLEAEAMFRAELEQLDSASPDDFYFVVWARGRLAKLHEERGEFDSAATMRRETLALLSERLGRDHPSMGEGYHLLGLTLLKAERPTEARPAIEEAARVYRMVLGERHASYASIMIALGEALAMEGRLAEADSTALIVLDIREQQFGRGSFMYMDALRHRATIQTRLGRYDVAESMLHEAIAGADSARGRGPEGIRAIHAAFADLYTATGRHADAARHRELARN